MRVGLTMRRKCPLFLQSLPKWWATEGDEKANERRFALQKAASLFADHVKPLLH